MDKLQALLALAKQYKDFLWLPSLLIFLGFIFSWVVPASIIGLLVFVYLIGAEVFK